MNTHKVEDKEKIKRDQVKKAVALAKQSRWEEAAALNQAILDDFPQDLEACNRLGKSLSEMGRNREARQAFEKALEISPRNSIAQKNLDRLTRIGDDAPFGASPTAVVPSVFIEESGAATVTSLVNLGPPERLAKLAPGHQVLLEIGGSVIKVTEASGDYVGQVEPRLASRLARLVQGGNKYEATVTSASSHALTIIVREVFNHPSLAGIVSFPSRSSADYRVYMPSALLGAELDEGDAQAGLPEAVKDWSDDDTEPGDEEAFSPVLHRIISAGDEGVSEDDEGL